MDPRDVKTTADAVKIVKARKLTHVKVGMFDNDGIMRGKYMMAEKFISALDGGFAFCDVVLGWDAQDQLYENVDIKYTGWHPGLPDVAVRILPGSGSEMSSKAIVTAIPGLRCASSGSVPSGWSSAWLTASRRSAIGSSGGMRQITLVPTGHR